jgi:NAD-reducing hydrogenase small subunit
MLTLATIWLDGCSGCHMSFLDIDQRLIDLASSFTLVYSPLVDRKVYPDHVDVALVEGAVSSDEDQHRVELVRARTTTLVALGDCAVTSNVPGMRNAFGVAAVLTRAYTDTANGPGKGVPPSRGVPHLLPRARPVHEVVPVDVFLPGCPPPADVIHAALLDLAAGRTPSVAGATRFGR